MAQQRSLMSFFSPRQNAIKGKDKALEKKDSAVDRSPLKPVNHDKSQQEDEDDKPRRKVRRLLDSDEEEETAVIEKEETKEVSEERNEESKSKAEKQPSTPPKGSPSSSKEDKTPPSGGSVTASGGIRKRKTARKHMRKVKTEAATPSADRNDKKEEKSSSLKKNEVNPKEEPASPEDEKMETSSTEEKTPKESKDKKTARKDKKRKGDSSPVSDSKEAAGTTPKRAPSEPAQKKLKALSPDPDPPAPQEIATPAKAVEQNDKDEESPKEAKKAEESNELPATPQNNDKKPPKKMFSWSAKKSNVEDKAETYKPGTSNYDPVNDACWKEGDRVPYLALANTLELIEETSGRLKIIEILTDYLWSVMLITPEDLISSVYLCLNKLAPAYEGVELKVGDGVLIKAISAATGRSSAALKTLANEKGDLGTVAQTSKCNQRMMFAPPKLTLETTFKRLREIANFSGNASMSKKVDVIKAILIACRGCESKYIIRSLSGKLRIGLAEQSVLAALGHAVSLAENKNVTSKKKISESVKKAMEESAALVKTAYCEMPSYDAIIPAILMHGVAELPKHCKLTPGVPLKPMLAHPTKGVSEVLNRFQDMAFICEFKYDGERAQIHILESGEVGVYSRNQEDNTTKYPDIISRIPNFRKDTVTSAIVDSESVAWDVEKKQIMPFQVLSTRKRKDASMSEIKVQVCVFAFDLLYLNGESLVRKTLRERRDLLLEHFQEVEGEFVLAKSKISSDIEDIQLFLDESVKGNCEGLMVKTLDAEATYEISKRSHNWLKLKKDYMDGTGDTLDLAVIGGYHGRGKRAGTYGGFLLACYDDENEEYQSICKIGTGLKDEELEQHSKFFSEHIIEKPRSYYRFDSAHTPDHWFDAAQVWEVKAADLSISPVHKAAMGLVDPSKGISLRFPRFLRIRDDKKPEEATNANQVADMYKSQDQIKNQASSNTVKEEDFY